MVGRRAGWWILLWTMIAAADRFADAQAPIGVRPAGQVAAGQAAVGQAAVGQTQILAAHFGADDVSWVVIEIPVGGEVLADTGNLNNPDSPLPPLSVRAVDQAKPSPVAYPVSSEVRIEVLPPSEQPVPRPGGGRLLGRLRNLIREVSGEVSSPVQVVARRIAFMLRGTGPVDVMVSDVNGPIGRFNVTPVQSAGATSQLKSTWWNALTDAAKRQIDASRLPPRVETYLVAMLSGRFDLPLPDWYAEPDAAAVANQQDAILETLKLIGGAASIEDQMFRRVASGALVSEEPANLPLPDPPRWAAENLPPFDRTAAVEPLADFVPPECFYLRFGSFENYLWFQNLTEQNGGDVARLVTIGGVAQNGSQRMQRQLHLQTTELTRTIGPSVIEDQAVIGRDLFLNDGASVGVLIKASQPFLLRTSLAGDRATLARQDPTVTLETFDQFETGDLSSSEVDIAGVTLLSSGDGTVRSFLAERDGVFFNTNSRHLMGRFLSVAAGDRSLADQNSFRYARTLMPLDRGDTVFIYVSPEMIESLLSPASMIELRRRLVTASEISLVHLARMANAQDGGPDVVGIDTLRQTEYLPESFGQRPDASGLIDVDGDLVIDSMRGRSGVMLAIADVQIDRVTASESRWYQSVASAYASELVSVDPIMVGIQRRAIDGNMDELSIHAEIAPFSKENYGKFADYLGPPTTTAMTFAPDDIAAISAHVASPQLGPPTHLFAAVKDAVPPSPDDFSGLLNIYRSLKIIPGYLGAHPRPGLLDRLPLGLGIGKPVSQNLNRLIGGLYRYTDHRISVLSFDPTIIENLLPFVDAVPSTVPAQIRGSVGDLRDSQLGPWINERLYETSSGNSRAGAMFLSSLMTQFSLTPVQALAQSSKILGGPVQCALGGQYIYDDSVGRFISTAWNSNSAPPLPPNRWVAPPLRWFAGGSFALLQAERRLTLDAVIRMRGRADLQN